MIIPLWRIKTAKIEKLPIPRKRFQNFFILKYIT